MNPLHKALYSICIISVLANCQNKPDFPKEPTIKIESLTRSVGEFSGDDVLLKIYFQDGNGDIGITDDERQTIRPVTIANAKRPYQEYFYTFNSFGQLIDSTRNKFHHNLFVKPFVQNASGEFVEVVFPDVSLDFKYGFKPLYEGNRQTPMEGTIEYKMSLSPPLFKKNDIVKFEIQICDRAKNLSNVVMSEPLKLTME